MQFSFGCLFPRSSFLPWVLLLYFFPTCLFINRCCQHRFAIRMDDSAEKFFSFLVVIRRVPIHIVAGLFILVCLGGLAAALSCFVLLCTYLSITIYYYLLLSIIIYYYLLLSIIIYHYLLLSIIIYYYLLLSIIIYYYLLLSINIYY